MIETTKSVCLQEIVNNISINQHILPDASGGTSEVYFLKEKLTNKHKKPHSVLLKHANEILPFAVSSNQEMFCQKVTRCQKLKDNGVNVAMPKEFMFVKNLDTIYETQDFALGEPVALASPTTIASRFLKRNFLKKESTSLDDLNLTKEEKVKAVDGFVAYNLTMINKLINAKEEHITKFLQDYNTVIRNKVNIDNNPENFLYDKKNGITFIDIGDVDFWTDPSKISDEKIYEDFKSVFSLSENMKREMTKTQSYLLSKKIDNFFKKTDSLVEKAGYVISDNLNLEQGY